MKKISVVIVPDMGSTEKSTHWYQWLGKQLKQLDLDVTILSFPTNSSSRQSELLPQLARMVDKNTIVVGHSIGAAAAFRLAEIRHLYGIVAVSANYIETGFPIRKNSGFYSHPWDWELINKQCNWIVQFASNDDSISPVQEARYIHEQLNNEYHEYTERGHFGSEYRDEQQFVEIVEVIKRKLFLD